MALAEEHEHTSGLTAARRYGTLVVVGGGCYGSYYVRQLRRARERGALLFDRILVVDRNAACIAAATAGDDLEIVVEEWVDFFARFLSGQPGEADAIVPSPLMPHLLFGWLEGRARNLFPARRVTVRAPSEFENIPWQREGANGTRYASFATWTCPVNCIEPRVCPHTRGERSWSMPAALKAHVDSSDSVLGARHANAIMHCTHRAYGVGMIDVADVLAAERALIAVADGHRATLLVGTVSHCHGALGLLVID